MDSLSVALLIYVRPEKEEIYFLSDLNGIVT